MNVSNNEKIIMGEVASINHNAYRSLNSFLVLDENNYIRDNNKIKVGFNYDYLVNEGANYLIFNNGYKDVYAFIIDKEYISKDVTMLHYEVDVLNTYLFDFELKESYVERKVCEIEELTDFPAKPPTLLPKLEPRTFPVA